jgi:hypothetical protein
MGTEQKNPGDFPMDYDSLRREGIRLIEKLGSQQWTDYNTHDPGITILEQLCYALTDLAYRIDYPIPDLLAEGGRNPYASLFRPEDILPSGPVTLLDLRKIVLDVEGVRNAWVEQIEQTPSIYFNKEEKYLSLVQEDQKEPLFLQGIYKIWIETETDNVKILNDVKERIHKYRNISEDFEVSVLMKQSVTIEATIEIEAMADTQRLQREIYDKIDEYFSPTVRFYSLNEFLDRKVFIDKVFEGPLLEHGFIDDQELERVVKRTELRISDIIRCLMDIEGVKTVQDIKFGDEKQWVLKLNSGYVPRLNENSQIVFLQEGISIPLNFSEKRKPVTPAKPQKKREIFPISSGQNRQIGDKYYAIPHQFPECYGIGSQGLPASASPSRQAQAKQLKAYLLLFDQLLANQFAQLANVWKLFSFTEQENISYFFQLVEDAALGLDENKETYLKEAVETGKNKERHNRFLNHLLARFAEQPSEYTSQGLLEEQIKHKQKYLQHYGNQSVESNGNAGIKRHIQLKLGLTDTELIIIEHILLRPISEDTFQNIPVLLFAVQHDDPYSLQLTVVVAEAKRDMIHAIRAELPAHLTTKFVLVDTDTLARFQAAWQKVMVHNLNHQSFRAARDHLIDLIKLGKTYPLTDIEVSPMEKMVAYGKKTKIRIKFSQSDVTYSLCDQKGFPVDAIAVFGNSSDLDLETPPVIGDGAVKYKILAEKNGEKKFLQQIAIVNVGLNIDLVAKIIEEIPNNKKELTSLENHKDIILIHRNSKVKVQVESAQEGVEYNLYNQLVKKLSESETGPGGNNHINIESFHITEDIEIWIQAKQDEDTIAWLAEKLPLRVRANTDLVLDPASSSVLSFDGKASFKIRESQQGVDYRAYIHAITDDEFMYGEKQDHWLKTDEEDVHIKPAWKWQETLADYIKADKTVAGNGGDIELELGTLRQDSLIVIEAIKQHKENTSKVQLKNALAFLVRPIDQTPTLKVYTKNEQIRSLQVSNGERGVFYHFRLEKDGEEICLPAYFHQWADDANSEDKGIERLRIGRDFVIADSIKDFVVLELFSAINLTDLTDLKLYIQAQRARTNVKWDKIPTVKIIDIEQILLED